MENLGAMALIPTMVVFVLAIITHRPIESLISGSIVGLVIIHGDQFIVGFAEASIRVMMDEDSARIGSWSSAQHCRPAPSAVMPVSTPMQPC